MTLLTYEPAEFEQYSYVLNQKHCADFLNQNEPSEMPSFAQLIRRYQSPFLNEPEPDLSQSIFHAMAWDKMVFV